MTRSILKSHTQVDMMSHAAFFIGMCVLLDNLVMVNLVVNSNGKKMEKQIAGLLPGTAAWRLIYEPCKITCGGSYQRSVAVCMKGDWRVDESSCNGDKPQEQTKPCGQQPCFSPRWRQFNYSDCSGSCGSGKVLQVSKCYVQSKNSNGQAVFLEVAERMCLPDLRPTPTPTPIDCKLPDCPQTLAKVDTSPGSSNDPKKGSNGAATSAVLTTSIVGLASLTAALFRILLFGS
ncbi:ADAMTS-like protein 3 [Neocloeon triangulifer]|uniref:ADAMTS-like protein 3 n=1 Tax=Neocloeon triangulifer TaxID=2078957 RepID=UPI00286F3112|nr:ADAMTS-like protein 3 [Neocloeon triangulifer]